VAILVNNLQETTIIHDEWLELLEKVLQQGLVIHQKPQAEVSVVLVTNDYIQELNLEYRGLDQPTDVLSFAMADEAPGEAVILPEEAPELLGDIYVSIERTVEQAAEYNHSFVRELCYLAVHGLLHLLGFDHQTTEQTSVMRAAEEGILAEFSLGRNGG
jgi:probable rRNA maturation factor